MSILGALRVVGTYDGRKYDKGVDKSKRKTKSFGKVVKGLGSVASTAFMGIAGAAIGVGTAFAGAVKEQIAWRDELAKTSDRLGITSRNLAAYQHAAGLSGMETSSLTTALEKMRDTIGAAAMGEAGAATALEQLGLDPETLKESINPLQDIFDAFGKIQDANQRMALARDVFGRGGAQMLNMMRQNLGEVTKEFEELYGVINAEDDKQFEQLNDDLMRLGVVWKGLAAEVATDIVPPLIELAQKAREAWKEIRPIWDAIMKGENLAGDMLKALWIDPRDARRNAQSALTPEQELRAQGIGVAPDALQEFREQDAMEAMRLQIEAEEAKEQREQEAAERRHQETLEMLGGLSL